jgi:hypothetical protein
MGIIPQRDVEGHELIKHVVAMEDMHYEPRSLDFMTAKYNSLYNRKHDNGTVSSGTDYGDGDMHFYDSTDTELVFQGTGYESETEAEFQTRLTSNCTKTEVHFEPSFDYSIRSGIIMLGEDVTYDAYVWCVLAPHISEESGGNVPFLAGGYNLKFFQSKSFIQMNGLSTFHIATDPIYYSHRIGTVVKHNAGDQIPLQMIFELYKD